MNDVIGEQKEANPLDVYCRMRRGKRAFVKDSIYTSLRTVINGQTSSNDAVFRFKRIASTPEQLRLRREEFKNKCAYCGCDLSDCVEELDHIIPTSKGGLNIIENLVFSCSFCNQSKGAKDVIPWLRSRKYYSSETEEKLISVFPYLLTLFPNYYD
jgi:5-methylcytosine-specific restriction endonuclease McrA